jgi:methyltransferase-like protein/cyclopropane fatty-acyl-phospholipid synthase-like methyltransferase
MSTPPGTSYDEVPYESKPLYATHPDCLAVAARLREIPAPLASQCRVLELGCAGGGNLIPLAYALPESRFVGVDLSQRQIDDGRRIYQRLGLANIELQAASIAEIGESWGKFDYIICHGVFSWVPPAIQDHILWIARHLLTEHGVAYISYNTNPGWRLKSAVRELMRYHADRFDDPQTKVQQARSILSFMAAASASLNHPLSHLFKDQAESLPKEADYYLYHEHLEDVNQAFYFHEFVAKARAAGLEYLGEAWHHTVIDNLPDDVKEGLEAISADLIDLEQFVDFLRSRTFRRTLLCHHENPIVRTPQPSVIEPLFVSALARPESTSPDITSDKPEKFILDDGTTATTNVPLFKAALVELCRQWPQPVAFPALAASIFEQLQIPLSQHEAVSALLASFLVSGYTTHLVALHAQPFPFTLSVSERPRASALARLVATGQSPIPSLRHRSVPLSAIDRLVLIQTDGTRTPAEIAQQVRPKLNDLPPSDADPSPPADQDAEKVVHTSLERLARSSLLEA